jgi:hypothetical protein
MEKVHLFVVLAAVRMKTPLFVTLALLMTAAYVPTGAASHGPTSCTVDYPSGVTSCTFYCHKGDVLSVDAQTTATGAQYPRLRATCGGVSVYCQAGGACQATSTSQVSSTGVGSCVAETINVHGTCSSIATPQSAVYGVVEAREFSAGTPAVSSPSVSDQDVYTPAVGYTCAPGGIVCVGPIAPMFVAHVEGVPSLVLVPASGVAVAYQYPVVTTPTLQSTSVGPVVVLGPPVPVVLCASTCAVPSGVNGGVDTEVTLTVYIGDEERTFTLP